MSSNSTSTESSVPTASPSSQAPSVASTTSLPESSPSSSSFSSSTVPSSTSANPSPSPATSSSLSTTPESNTPTTPLPSTSTIQSTTQVPTVPTTPTQTPTTNPPTTTTQQPSTVTQTPTTSPIAIPTPSTSIITQDGSTRTVLITSTAQPTSPTGVATGSSSSSSSSASSTAGLQGGASSSGSSGLSKGGVVAVAVVVPIVAVTLLVLAALFLWRKRKARKDAEELRRKEVEEYGYNPNNDPTLPAVAGGSAGHDGPFEMREDGSSGYRGWGTTTAVGSSGRKASTTISGGQSAGGIGMAYSEGTSPTQGPTSDTRSDNPLVGEGHSVEGHPGETEALGAMGPAASGNRNGDINRGPSNASSSYSAAGRSDGSGEMGGYGGAYNQYDAAGNPYNGETPFGSPPGRAEMGGQPVIRDVQARRNTRIENPAHFPQQSAGISQNF